MVLIILYLIKVVTLATYVFFIFTIIGRQKIDGFSVHKAMRSGRIPLDIDLYIPIFTVLQFFFYMGLLKVAEQLINPFGDDDEDFELNWLIDRHVKVNRFYILYTDRLRCTGFIHYTCKPVLHTLQRF